MMGNQGAGQAPLFYAFNLDDHVPRDHLLRGIDHFLDRGPERHRLRRLVRQVATKQVLAAARAAHRAAAIQPR
jgi:hypothetical protein